MRRLMYTTTPIHSVFNENLLSAEAAKQSKMNNHLVPNGIDHHQESRSSHGESYEGLASSG